MSADEVARFAHISLTPVILLFSLLRFAATSVTDVAAAKSILHASEGSGWETVGDIARERPFCSGRQKTKLIPVLEVVLPCRVFEFGKLAGEKSRRGECVAGKNDLFWRCRNFPSIHTSEAIRDSARKCLRTFERIPLVSQLPDRHARELQKQGQLDSPPRRIGVEGSNL